MQQFFHRRSKIRGFLLAGLALVGSHSFAADLFTDSFESGNLSHTENSVKWESGAYTSVTTSVAHTGTHSLLFAYAAGDDSWAEQRFNLGKDYTEVYIEWYAYYPSGKEGNLGPRFAHSAASGPKNNKFLRIWKGDTSDGDEGYSKFYVKLGASTDLSASGTGDERIYGEYGTDGGGMGPNGPTGSGTYAGGGESFITDTYRGRWINMKVHVKVASAANNDGVIEIWRDGALISSVKNLAIYPSGGTGNALNVGYLMGWANAGFAQNTNMYIDDVRISTSGTAAATPSPPTSVSVQ